MLIKLVKKLVSQCIQNVPAKISVGEKEIGTAVNESNKTIIKGKNP